jgi:hypothetical protein
LGTIFLTSLTPPLAAASMFTSGADDAWHDLIRATFSLFLPSQGRWQAEGLTEGCPGRRGWSNFATAPPHFAEEELRGDLKCRIALERERPFRWLQGGKISVCSPLPQSDFSTKPMPSHPGEGRGGGVVWWDQTPDRLCIRIAGRSAG